MTSLLPFDEQLCLRLTMTLLHFVWQGAAIALAAVLATLALRRAAPNLRYGALLMSLLMMAACPPLTFLLMPAAAEAPAASSAYEPADPGMQFPPGQLRPEADGPEALAKPAGRVAPKVIGRAAGLLAHLSAPEHWRAWSRYVVAAYVAGVLLAFGRLSLGICGGTRLRRVSEPVLDRDLLASPSPLAGSSL